MDKFAVTIIHRPEMVPEYAEKVTGHGKEEDISRDSLLTESLDIFKTQQAIAHKNGLKTTIQMTYASLFNEEAVALAKADPAVAQAIDGKNIVKEIYVKGRIVNIVAK